MDNIRALFEKWIHSRKTIMLPLTLDKEGWYYSTSTDNAYQAYQAATLAQQKKVEALEIQVQKLRASFEKVNEMAIEALDADYEICRERSLNDVINICTFVKNSNTPNISEWVRKDSLSTLTNDEYVRSDLCAQPVIGIK